MIADLPAGASRRSPASSTVYGAEAGGAAAVPPAESHPFNDMSASLLEKADIIGGPEGEGDKR